MAIEHGTSSSRTGIGRRTRLVALLEGTNQVFRAFRIETPRSSIHLQAADQNPHAVVTCTLTSTGFNFETPWTLVGFIAP